MTLRAALVVDSDHVNCLPPPGSAHLQSRRRPALAPNVTGTLVVDTVGMRLRRWGFDAPPGGVHPELGTPAADTTDSVTSPPYLRGWAA